MNRVTGIIVAGVMVLLMVGCGGRRYPQALLLADSLMNSRPDSALAVLEGAEGQMAGGVEVRPHALPAAAPPSHEQGLRPLHLRLPDA